MKRIVRMPATTIISKVLKRFRQWLDIPLSAVELRTWGIEAKNSNHGARSILREFQLCLRDTKDLVVFDIGGLRGDYAGALGLSDSVKSIVSFEPVPDSFNELVQRAKLNPKVMPVNVALGDEDATVSFFMNDSRASSSPLPMLPKHVESFPHTGTTSEISVRMKRLDDLMVELGLEQPDVIKLDVQGFEAQVIRGGKQTFSRAKWCHVELSLVPLYDGAATFYEVYIALINLGYQISDLTDRLVSPDGIPLQVNALFRREPMQGIES